jgi:hypothetical protein
VNGCRKKPTPSTPASGVKLELNRKIYFNSCSKSTLFDLTERLWESGGEFKIKKLVLVNDRIPITITIADIIIIEMAPYEASVTNVLKSLFKQIPVITKYRMIATYVSENPLKSAAAVLS